MSFTAPMKRKYRHLLFPKKKRKKLFWFCFTIVYERLVLGAKPTDETVLSFGNMAKEQEQCSTH
jgi:hypothetical protein